MIEKTAPYAPTDAVISVIHTYRERPVPTPIDLEVLQKIGVKETIAPRTLQALKLLDLVDEGGHPTIALQDLREAGSDEYRTRLAEVVRTAYMDVFTYRDPATDDISKIQDQFRKYHPVSMRPRMLSLFLGLCAEAGIIEESPKKIMRAEASRRKNVRVVKPVAKVAASGSGVRTDATITPRQLDRVDGSDHLAIRGLLMTLPPVGSVFPEEKRREWADAVLAAFNLIYLRAPDSAVLHEPNSTLRGDGVRA